MTRDEIIKLAREAECSETWGADAFQFTIEELERFAALVAAAEREAVARLADEWQNDMEKWGHCDCATAIRSRGQV